MKNSANKILFSIFLILSILTTTSWAIDPVPDIKANGSDGPVIVSLGEPFTLTVQLDPGSMGGEEADWYLGVNVGGWHHYELSKVWTPGIDTTHQGRLFNLNPRNISGKSDLPIGSHTFYFAVDTVMNGSLNMDQIYLDRVKMTVVSNDPQVMLSECLNNVNQGNILEARYFCVTAADSFGDVDSNDADTARFFAVQTQVIGLWFDMASDNNQGNGLITLGDILDGFGCSQAGRNPLEPSFMCPEVHPSNSPTGADLQAHINNVVKPMLEDSIDRLDSISQSFNKSWIEPFDGADSESDFGDVLALRSLLKFILSSVIIGNSYNFDVDIDNAQGLDNTEAFLASNPAFLTLTDDSELPIAQNLLSEASDDTLSAISWIQNETDGQNNDWINLQDTTPGEIEDAIVVVNSYKTSLTGPVILDDGTLNFFNLFTGINLRSLIPPFNENTPGFFPDPTFDNLWTNWNNEGNVNLDNNSNGIPDILE